MILIGHRGCSYPGYNQNTIRAFEKVASEGVPAIEFDVQLSKDRELVIVHNLDLEEVSNGTGRVSQTDSTMLRTLWAGEPARGRDRIPFLSEAFEFFASIEPVNRPKIHMELKGDDTGTPSGELLKKYLDQKKLRQEDILVSSFNWKELQQIRKICPDLQIALLDGAIRRNLLLEKTGPEADRYFEKIFTYGSEQYMLPRFASLEENQPLIEAECENAEIRDTIEREIEICLTGGYYNDALLQTAIDMKALSVNLWFKTVPAVFIKKAHECGLAVFVYTVNDDTDLQNLANMGVDGIFTDYYLHAARLLTPFL